MALHSFVNSGCALKSGPSLAWPSNACSLLSRNHRRVVVTAAFQPPQVLERGLASFHQVGDCILYSPPRIKRQKPKAIVQFLGGAFIGAAPELTYSLFLELLTKEGFLVIATPYDVSFDHETSARKIDEKWSSCLDYLYTSGCPSADVSPLDVSGLPLVSIGHSNGALMQVLIGSICRGEKLPKNNVIISFNNKPAADAVPLFDQIGPLMSQVTVALENTPIQEFSRSLMGEAGRLAFEEPIFLPLASGKETLESIRRFVKQIPSVLNQVAEGTSEFQPEPAQNRVTVSTSYTIPNNLLIKFSSDMIDESDILEDILQPRVESIGGRIMKRTLSGTHLTPLAQGVTWQVGKLYTPFDAFGQTLRSIALADLRNLVQEISLWINNISM